MQRNFATTLLLFFLLLWTPVSSAQSDHGTPPADITQKTINAIGYPVGQGTKVDLKGAELMPQGNGEAKVEAKVGATTIEAEIKNMASPSTLGAEFLTFVLWVVSPEGRTSNLGEIPIDKNGEGKLKATTPFQTFSLFVTAEPYFAVRQPSELVVLQNELKKGTKGKIFPVKDYPLLKRNQYQKLGNPLALTPDLKNVPLDMYEARNAVDIAKSRGADKYAPDIFSKAEGSLQIAENSLAKKDDNKVVISNARQTAQFAEDARLLTEQNKEKERIANEQAAAAAKAKAQAESTAAAEAAVAKQKANEEAERQSELASAKQAQLKAEADVAQAKADAAQAKANASQAEAERTRTAAATLRAQLLDQFNRVLTTRDTSRGLVVNMGDVLFATGKYDLRQEAQIALAKLSGIILSHPGLNLKIEGYTDSVGSDEFNLKLSNQRADAVREYLINQGLTDTNVTASGLGKSDPVASNDSPTGRQQNRRVEIIVSGEVIGMKIGT
jgi:outer membrane protein OmpA-like peptidoglycan-associated protein